MKIGIHHTDESMRKTIDRLRQRHLTFEESSKAAWHARAMELGVNALEIARQQEDRLATAAVEIGRRFAPGSDADGSGDFLRELMALVLRQAGFAAATEDPTEFTPFMEQIGGAIEESKINPAFVESCLEGLRDACADVLPPAERRQLDDWLNPAARYLSARAELGAHGGAVVDAAVQAAAAKPHNASGMNGSFEPWLRRRAANLLRQAALHLLPEGEERIHTTLSDMLKAEKGPELGPEADEAFCETLVGEAATRFGAGRTIDYLQALESVADIVIAMAEFRQKIDGVVAEAWKRAKTRNRDASGAADACTEKAHRDIRLVCEAAFLASRPGGREPLMRMLADMEATLRQFQFGAKLISETYREVGEVARDQLSGRVCRVLMPGLEPAVRVMAIIAELGEKRDAMISLIVDELGKNHAKYLDGHDSRRAYVARDLEQVLSTLALGLLPGAAETTVGKFSIFGETISHGRFGAELMAETYDLLERALMGTLSAAANAHLIPQLQKYKKHMHACLHLGHAVRAIAKDGVDYLQQNHAAAASKHPHGAEKFENDIRTLVFTAAATQIPNAEFLLPRGMWRMTGNQVMTRMDPAMVCGAWEAVAKSAKKNMAKPELSWIVPHIDACVKAIHATIHVAQCMDAVVKEAADAVFARHPELATKYAGARRRAEEDFEVVLRLSLLAAVPGGREWLAHGAWRMGDTIFRSAYSATMITNAYADLAKAALKSIDRASRSILSPHLEEACRVIALSAEVAEKKDELLDGAISAAEQADPSAFAQTPYAKQRARRLLVRVLRTAVVGSMAGSEQYVNPHIVHVAETTSKSRFGRALADAALPSLVAGCKNLLSRGTRKPMLPVLEKTASYLAIMADISENESRILDQSIDQLLSQRSNKTQLVLDVGPRVRADQRMVLRSAAESLVPGGNLHHAYVLEALRAANHRGEVDADLVRDAYAVLGRTCASVLKHGPVQELKATIDRSAAFVAS